MEGREPPRGDGPEPAGGAGDLDVVAYAALVVALAEGGRPRDAILAGRGLDEATWSAIDGRWQARLSRAMETEADGVPPLLAAYAEAFARARAASSAGARLLTVEELAEVTREIQKRGDPTSALARMGVTLTDFLRANEHWTRRMIADPEILERYRRVLG